MNQVIRKVGDYTVTFTWLPVDGKVFVKYYKHNNELENFDLVSKADQLYINNEVERFFESIESFNLIKWSY